MERYQGKKVVIIGGTSGMGLATAKMLLDGGARVLVTGRSQAGLDSAQKELGKGALVVSSDARSLTDIDALASRVKAEFDTFDLLSVSAGFSIRAPLESMTEDRLVREVTQDVSGNSHSLLACVVLPKVLMSWNAKKSFDCWLKRFWSARIPSPFVTAFRFLQLHHKTGAPKP
jgi:NAD(P)-dependent dehydrogenase (short-subunit alcohol dehydrogenase family)